MSDYKKQIRKRQSYKGWVELARFLMTQPPVYRIMERFYRELDNRRAFGSRTNSWCSKESMKQALIDIKLGTSD